MLKSVTGFTSCSEQALSMWILRSLWNTAKECSSEILIFGLFSAENFFSEIAASPPPVFYLLKLFLCRSDLRKMRHFVQTAQKYFQFWIGSILMLQSFFFLFCGSMVECSLAETWWLWFVCRLKLDLQLNASVSGQSWSVFNCTSARSNWR